MVFRPLYEGIKAVYGQVADPANLTIIQLPFPMRLSWDKAKVVNKMTCHKLIANDLIAALGEILGHYGLERIQELGIDLFGGCLNVRAMRGSTKWSTHALAIALDLDPDRNKLHETKKTARFAKPEYAKMIEIFEKYGFYNQGKYKDNDWMHFQAVRYK